MRAWLLGTLACALVALLCARYLGAPHWLYGLWGTIGFAAMALALAAGLVARHLWPAHWLPTASAVLGAGATLMRVVLTQTLVADPARAARIELADTTLAAASMAWGTLALFWGTHGVLAAFDAPPASPAASGAQRLARILLAGMGVSGGLYALAPLRHFFGLRINHWTILGLAALVGIASLLDRAYLALRRRRAAK